MALFAVAVAMAAFYCFRFSAILSMMADEAGNRLIRSYTEIHPQEQMDYYHRLMWWCSMLSTVCRTMALVFGIAAFIAVIYPFILQ